MSRQIRLGVTRQFLDCRVSLFANGSLGATRFDPKEQGYWSEWLFGRRPRHRAG